MFSDILLTVDFDRTLTGPDGTIPRRNLEAIEYFMANGGKFTVNTGRSVATFWKYLDTVPANAPFLLYNGGAAYEKGRLSQLQLIDLPVWQTLRQVRELFPKLNLEIQGTQVHYLLDATPNMVALYEKLQWRYAHAQWEQDVGPFLKFSLFGEPRVPVVADLYKGSSEEIAVFDEAEEVLRRLYGQQVEVFRAAPRIIDVHAKGCSKLAAARLLQKRLGRRVLVCVGDGENDVSMLNGADYAFCPADAIVAGRYESVGPCGEGAVADVIFQRIPEILQIQP